MTRLQQCLFVLFFCGASLLATAQKIVYSEPDNEDGRKLNFEIAGKISGNFLIYKNIRNHNWITVLDNDMKQVNKVELDYVPDNDRMINVDFFPYGTFCYMIYQYQKHNIVHCVAAKLDGNGNKVGDIIELDTTQIGFAASNKIYSVISSEDKSRIIVFKINSRNKSLYMLTSTLLDDKFAVLKKSRLSIDMDEKNDYLDQFQLDNDGDLVFTKFDRVNSENIGKASLVIKYALADSLMFQPLNLENTYLDEIHIKPDNFNKRYIVSSFYFKKRRSSVDGFYFYIWDKATQRPSTEQTMIFDDDLRKEAKGSSATKAAFDDYFIRNIIPRRDGGFIIASEAYYTTSRGNAWNRWNNVYGSPYYRSLDYYNYSPFYNSYGSGYGYNRWSDQNVRYQADNIAILSFDKNGKIEWRSVINKEQYDDQTEDLISYEIMNTGGLLHFLFNQQEKRVLILTDYALEPNGQIDRNPTLKNLDKGFDFMPRYAKQVTGHQIIVPCQYRNYICFAKIDYN